MCHRARSLLPVGPALVSRGWGILGGIGGTRRSCWGGAGRAKLRPQTRTGCAGGRSGAQTHLALLDLHLIYLMPPVCSAIRRHQTLQGRGMDGQNKQRLNINLPQGLKDGGGGQRGPVAFGVPLQVGGSPWGHPGTRRLLPAPGSDLAVKRERAPQCPPQPFLSPRAARRRLPQPSSGSLFII